MPQQFFAVGPGLRRGSLKVKTNINNFVQCPFSAFAARPLKNTLYSERKSEIMRIKHFIILVVFAVISACSTNVIDYQIIKVINHYEQNEKNIQLGKDLLYYNYMPGLAEQIEDFNDEDAKNIRWEYFIRESDQQVSFRVKLNVKNSTIRKNKETIIAYFKEEVEKKYQFHIKNEQLFLQAANFSAEVFAHIDAGEYEKFWAKCNELITGQTDKKQFISQIKQGKTETGPVASRELTSKQYYFQPFQGQDRRLFTLNYNSKYANYNAVEQLTIEFTDKFSIVGIRSNEMKGI